VAITMLVVWSVVAFSGFLLWLAPAGPRSGYLELLFGLDKRGWGELHFWVSVVALAVTALHLVIDWRALRACVCYLTSRQRGPAVEA
jgi:hypothetical protein